MKNISKTVMIFAFCVVLAVVLLGGCKIDEEQPPEPEPEPVIEVEEPVDEPAVEVIAPIETLPDDPYSFIFMLDGDLYAVPTPFSAFAVNGWTIIDTIVVNAAKSTLDPYQYTGVVYVQNGERKVSLDLVNTSEETKKLADCNVGGISFDSDDAEKYGSELVFPGSLRIGDPGTKVIELYGEPSDFEKSDVSAKYAYSLDIYSSVEIIVDNKNGLVSSLRMRNLDKKEKAAEVTSEAPYIVKSYRAPSELGDSWDSYTAIYGGELYKLPVPVSVFMENGWIPVSDENAMIDANDFWVGFEIRNGNQVLCTSIWNYDKSPQPAKYCFITRIEYSGYGATVPVELPKGISENSSLNDLINAYGDPTSTDEGSSYKYYTWGELFEGLSVSIDKSTNKIARIELEYLPESL